jgi:hypothetical protein
LENLTGRGRRRASEKRGELGDDLEILIELAKRVGVRIPRPEPFSPGWERNKTGSPGNPSSQQD